MTTRVLGLVLGVLLIGVELGSAQTTPPAIPELAKWEQLMLQYGEKHCQMLQGTSASGDEKLAGTYYDAERVYYQIADYTKDSKWLACAQAAEKVYRDSYLYPNDGKLPGFWIFPHGLWKDYKRAQDTRSKDAVFLLQQNGAYGQDSVPLSWLTDPGMSREVAYNLQTKILAKDLGQSTDESIKRLSDVAFGHMNAWFVDKTAPYIRPFMVALTSEALIMYYNRTGDSRVLPALKLAWNDLWARAWLPNCMCFMYTDRPSNDDTGGTEPAPDLSLLIAPVFGWLYYVTNDPIWQQRGDQVFAGGVLQAFFHGAKQFNQGYRWSFDYVTWRKKSNATFVTFDSMAPPPSGGTGTTPPPDGSGDGSTGGGGSDGSTGGGSGSDGGSTTPPPPSTSFQNAIDALSKDGLLWQRRRGLRR